MLGSVAEGVKNHTAASILLARNDPPPRRILVPVDGSRGSKRAAGLALRLSKAWDAPASFLHVVEPLAAVPEVALRDAVAKSLSGIDLQWTQPRATAAVEVGKPGDAILRAAERERAGLVVMGSRGLTGLRSIVAGSVSNRVAHAARTSVLLVKEPSD
jgi:nucleotide-binding universal stress UspA family protein